MNPLRWLMCLWRARAAARERAIREARMRDTEHLRAVVRAAVGRDGE